MRLDMDDLDELYAIYDAVHADWIGTSRRGRSAKSRRHWEESRGKWKPFCPAEVATR